MFTTKTTIACRISGPAVIRRRVLASALVFLAGGCLTHAQQPATEELALPIIVAPNGGGMILPEGATVRMNINGEDVDPTNFSPASASLRISDNDLNRWGKILNFTPEQLEAAKTLRSGFDADLSKAREEAKPAIDAARAEMRDGLDPEVMRRLSGTFQTLRDKRDAAEKQFIADLKSLLTKEQEPLWPRIERLRRRESPAPGMSFSSVAGERVDLIKLVDQLKLPEAQQTGLAQLLEQYEQELDAAIVSRNELMQSKREKIDALLEKNDPEGITAFELDELRARARLREINQRWAKRLTDELGSDTGPRFKAAADRAIFPSVHRERAIHRALSAAEGFDDLTKDQRSALVSLRQKFADQSAGLNSKLEAQIVKQEEENVKNTKTTGGPTGNGNTRERRVAVMRSVSDSSEMQEIRAKRKQIDDATMKELDTILSESQRAKLPKNTPRGNEGERPAIMPMPAPM